jgi:hypothetical protein
MLIRSQNKKCLVDMTTITIQVSGMMVVCYDTSQVFDDVYICLGTYESEAKAMKVLDMIQEAYGDSEYTKYVIPEVCRTLSMKPRTEENKAHAGELGEMLKKGMTFQMPEDSEVEA